MKLFKIAICTATFVTLSANVLADMYSKCYEGNTSFSTSLSPADSIRKHRRPARKPFNKSGININESFDEYSKRVREDFDESKKDMERRFIEYRDSVINDFVKALDRPWEDENSNNPLPKPIDNSVGPQIVPEKEPVIEEEPVIEKDVPTPTPKPIPEEKVEEETIPEENNEPISKENRDKTIIPVPEEKINPEEEIKRDKKPDLIPIPGEIKPKNVLEIPKLDGSVRPAPFVPVVVPENIPYTESFTFEVFGTDMEVSLDQDCKFKLTSNDNYGVAEAIKTITSNAKYTALLQQCLDLRQEYQLCDWAYLKTLEEMSNQFLGSDTNEARLLTGYLFCMSGYKVRFAFTSGTNLLLLGACEQSIVNTPYLTLPEAKGSDTYYILLGKAQDSSLQICNYEMPGEKAMSLNILEEPLFSSDIQHLAMQLHSYPSITFDYKVNKNLIDFYDSYPVPLTKGDSYSKWVYYANAPMSSSVKSSLYPAIVSAIQGKEVREQTDIIMNFIESFKYGYDDKVWGYDRAFFPDETIFYPESDCEDHAILLTRIVRDLIGLETALVYYPGHLAAAVCFDDSSSYGDYITHNGKKYTICDPTIYYSGHGRTMRGMNNSEATLIIVR